VEAATARQITDRADQHIVLVSLIAQAHEDHGVARYSAGRNQSWPFDQDRRIRSTHHHNGGPCQTR